LTATFPFGSGETFLEDEVLLWQEEPLVDLVISPMNGGGDRRGLPEGISLVGGMTSFTPFRKAWFVGVALFHRVFWSEILFLMKTRQISLWKVWAALKCTAQTLFCFAKYSRAIGDRGGVAYSYWNHAQAYAAVMLKRQGFLEKVVSRAHRFDLYQEQNRESYMPLKRQFLNGFDCIYVISDSAKEYVVRSYGVDASKVSVSRLGVPLSQKKSIQHNSSKVFHLLSVSFCTPVKRIDKIIEALALVSRRRPTCAVRWTHIGDGVLFEQLQQQAKIRLQDTAVEYEMLGRLENREVRGFLKDQFVDCFINTSDSEGVPVSIMEAMSFAVPSIAPNVGGVAELVSSQCGYLLVERASVEQVATAIEYAIDNFRNPAIKEAARVKAEVCFNDQRNYREFIQSIMAN
jgi:glycosyltransferase involved in cell wall biosynthesis